MSCINKNDKAFRYLAYKFGEDAAENIVRSYTRSKNSEEFVFPTVRQALKFIQDNKDSQVENVKSNIKQGDNTTENILRNLKGILTVHDSTVYITKGWLDEAGTALREEQKRIVFDENYRRVQELAKEFPTIFEIKDTRFPYTKVINLNGEEKVEVPDLIDLVPVETIEEKIENEFFEKQKEEEDYLAKQEDIEEIESDLGERSKKNSITVTPGVEELLKSNTELANNLENKLKDFLTSINVDTIVVDNLQKRLQEKGLNSDAVAVSDILHKAVFLDSNKYNTLDYAEEVATFAIEFMGASNHPEASPLIKTALANITTWKKYQQYYDLYKDDSIYKNNERKLKVEILSKLLAEKIVESKDKTKKTKQDKKLTILETIVNDILALFDKIWKSDYYKAVDRFLKQRGIETKGVSKINIKPFDAIINEIVDDILFNNTSKIVNDSSRARKGETAVSLKEVLENNPTIKEIYHKLNSLGFMFTGSPSLSNEGIVYRESNDKLHDLDWQVPKELESNWLDLVKETFPGLTYKINPKTNQAQIFTKSEKTTHSLMIKGMPVDFFINLNPPSTKNKFGDMRWQDTFEAKMDMGRHKDIRDLIDFKTSFNDYFSNPNYVYYSLGQSKPGVSELFDSNPELASIGTPEQYSQYLDTIFPDSQVKDIVYHGTSNLEKVKSEGFNKSKLKTGEGTNLQGAGFYFAKFKQVLSNYAKGEKGGFVQAIVNLKNPLQERNFPEFLKRELNEENVSFENVIEVGEKVDNWLSNNNKDGVIWNQISSFKEGTAEQETTREKLFGTAYNKNQKTLDVEHYSVKEPEQIHILGGKQDIEGFKEFVGKENTSNEELTDDIKEFLSTFEDNFPWFSNLTLPERIEFFKSIDKDEIDVNCKL